VPAPSGGAAVEVRVELKPGVFDAEADSIAKSLKLLGIEGLSEVGTARLYRLTFSGASPEEARARAERAVDRLLANPVIHRVAIVPV
jgi:phosphoribosylformylglycinamidine synthase PurS subunit